MRNRDDNNIRSSLQKAAYGLIAVQVVLLFIFYTGGYEFQFTDTTEFNTFYNIFLGVEIMMFVGFGYLMTFLKDYGFGSVALTMMITAIGLQVAILTEQGFAAAPTDAGHTIGVTDLINSLFAIAALLITFGGVIGKVTPFQLLIMTIVEFVFYSFNHQVVLTKVLGIQDCGGTIIIHMFGCYFGLAAATAFPSPDLQADASYLTDLFAGIGTVFLWIYWPSFVGGGLAAGSDEQQTAVFNTILALSASTITTVASSILMSDDCKIRPVDIQNATLAGGVSVGVLANLVSPYTAIFIGMLAGVLSTYGFMKLQFGFDSCGIHNLHGMPSVLGGLASAFIGFVYPESGFNGTTQLMGVILTLAFAAVTGKITGHALAMVDQFEKDFYFDTTYLSVNPAQKV
jgi:ammonium transporter Rh